MTVGAVELVSARPLTSRLLRRLALGPVSESAKELLADPVVLGRYLGAR